MMTSSLVKMKKKIETKNRVSSCIKKAIGIIRKNPITLLRSITKSNESERGNCLLFASHTHIAFNRQTLDEEKNPRSFGCALIFSGISFNTLA